MSTVKTTAKGTSLPILKLRGKDYLEVKWRLVWFREEHPDWSIETKIVHHEWNCELRHEGYNWRPWLP